MHARLFSVLAVAALAVPSATHAEPADTPVLFDEPTFAAPIFDDGLIQTAETTAPGEGAQPDPSDHSDHGAHHSSAQPAGQHGDHGAGHGGQHGDHGGAQGGGHGSGAAGASGKKPGADHGSGHGPGHGSDHSGDPAGGHVHKKGGWMVSYRYMRMFMDNLRNGTDEISAEDVAAFPNTATAAPPVFRVVPTDMVSSMHMVGVMYSPTDRLRFMVMGGWVEKDMDHITFAGPVGTTVLGTFKVRTEGFSDTRVSALMDLFESGRHKVHANFGIGLPSGSFTETTQILTPMGTRPTVRAPFSMQIGTGTVDLMPTLTYEGHLDHLAWGFQLSGFLPLGKNDAGYSWGRLGRATLWGAYHWSPWLTTSLSISGQSQGAIDGGDELIAVPNPTADPDNYGGRRVDIGVGMILTGQTGFVRGHQVEADVTFPLYQNLNGPQLGHSAMLKVGYRIAF